MDKYKDDKIVFTGTLILDRYLSPKQQRDKVFQLMHDAGVNIEDPDSLEIGFEGVDDNDGLSETQTSDFIVYRKKNKDSSKELLISSLQAIKELRKHLETVVDSDERKRIIDELFEKTDELEKRIGNVSEIDEGLVVEFDEIDKGIKEVEDSIKGAIKEYQDSSNRLQVILNEQEKAFNSVLLSEEEINKLREEYADKKLEENNRSVLIQHQISEQRQLLKALKRKKNKLEKNVEKASSLGISVSNYEDITNTLQKTNIVNAILEEKGLDEIVEKKASLRTKEEKKKIREAKEEIVEEISKVQKEENLSVLDAIEALYSIQVEYKMNKSPRVLIVKEKQLNSIKEHVGDVPERIVGEAKVYDYIPEEVPEDLKDIEELPREQVFEGTYLLTDEEMSEEQQRNKIFDLMRIAGISVDNIDDFEISYGGIDPDRPDSTRFVVYRKVLEDKKEKEVSPQLNVSLDYDNGLDERIVFFLDEENHNDTYVRDYVIKRFNIIPNSEEVKIDESLCFKIDEDAKNYILDNQHNSYSPYFVEERIVSIPKVEKYEDVVEEKAIDKIVLYQDLDNSYEKYVNNDTIKRFNLIPTSEETTIDDNSYYRIDNNDAEYIISNQDNDTSPYDIEFRETHLGNVNQYTADDEIKNTEIISLYRDVDNNNEVYVKKYVIDRFHFVPLSNEIRIDNNPCYQIDNDAAGYLITNANNSSDPYEIEIQDIALGKKIPLDENNTVEEIEFYEDIDNNHDIYVKQNVISRFHLQPIGSGEMILNALCYHISREDADRIINNQGNEYSPYHINTIEVTLNKDVKEDENFGIIEKMVLYKKDDQVYVNKYTLNRFHLKPVGKEVRIDGKLCYPIAADDYQLICKLQNNDYSPFKIEMRNMIPKEQEEKVENKENVVSLEKLILYRKDNQYYLSDEMLEHLHLEPSGQVVIIDGNYCHPITQEEYKQIVNSKNNYQIEVRNMVLKKKEDTKPVNENISSEKKEETKKVHDNVPSEKNKITIDSILEKIKVDNYEIIKNQPYQAKNIRVSRQFASELKKGDWLYNIIHLLSYIRKASSELLRKLSDKFLNTSLKKAKEQLEDNIDNLSDEEKIVLLREYDNIDFVDEINAIITSKMNEFVATKLKDAETTIQDGYDALYTFMGQIRELEKLLMDNHSNELKNSYLKERKRLLERAAVIVCDILEARGIAQDILTPTILDSIEDFDDRYPYIGMRYRNELSPELERKEEEYRGRLKEAFKKKDRLEIVSNFMGMESCFFEDSRVLTEKDSNSIGIRYFDDFVDEFGYQDDDFSRKLFHIVAENSAKNREILRDRYHEIKSGTLLDNTSYGTISIKDLNLESWTYNDDSFSEDVSYEIDNIMLQYSVGNASKDETINRLKKLEKDNNSYLVEISNTINSIIYQYSKKHKEFDYASIEEQIEAIIANPGVIGNNDILSSSLCKIPNLLLKKLVDASVFTQLVKDINSNLKENKKSEDLEEENIKKH